MEYNFSVIEAKWRKHWKVNNTYTINNDSNKPKCYVLDMFPYPSGAGLHVGHPLGYIASDIYARYKRQKGFNVLHPMGFDSFGLPAEQYALETGQHPAQTTKVNIARYKEQLENIGFCYDWSREVQTSDPNYYKWTQWIFTQLYNAWYNTTTNKVEKIDTLIETLYTTDANWATKNNKEKEALLMQYRLAFRQESYVNWCEALGTVLANDEVINGVSERGSHPVERRKMNQWFLRITKFADRLLDGLDELEYPESLKEMQRNWIGKSEGANIQFNIQDAEQKIEVFTTRPDTIFGVSFMVVAPEHELLKDVMDQEVIDYIQYVKSRSERERMTEVKKITGCFTGKFAIHPFTHLPIPIWTSEYVLAGYGTGAIMAVPCGDDRDYAFAKHFNIAIPNIFSNTDISEKACTDKNTIICNSDFLDLLPAKEAIKIAIENLETAGIGTKKINYKLRDAGFSRQRYWGEPFPVQYDADGLIIIDNQLPLELPHVEKYSAGPNGKGPLANELDWMQQGQNIRETDTMPGYAGSSWYYLRYMDAHNPNEFASRKATDYWNQVDVYVGGAEHAVGHLLYSRMWCKSLHDLGFIGFDEPYKKIINQGMIGGNSRFIYRIWSNFSIISSQNILDEFPKDNDNWSKIPYPEVYVTKKIAEKIYNKTLSIQELTTLENLCANATSITKEKFAADLIFNLESVAEIHVEVSCVDGEILSQEKFKTNSRLGNENSIFLNEEDGNYYCGVSFDKMSKSKYNVVNPDDIITQYGADTFRMYEMFLGPIQDSKPWDTKGIEGTHRFLKKLWRMFYNDDSTLKITTDEPSKEEYKILHKHIKKITYDIEHFAYNTSISQFMITTNELSALNCNKRKILEPLLITLAPFAPHIAEELFATIGNTTSVLDAHFPDVDETYLIENSYLYPIAVNGKARATIEFDVDADAADVQAVVLQNETVQKWLEGREMKKFIFVKGKMVNVVG